MAKAYFFTKAEDEIIRHYLEDSRRYSTWRKCQMLHEKHIPNHNARGIYARWRHLIGAEDNYTYVKTSPYWYGEIDLKDLLSPEQQKRIRLHIPIRTGRVRKIKGS